MPHTRQRYSSSGEKGYDMTEIFSIDPVHSLEQDCLQPKATQKDIALDYAFCLRSYAANREAIDWKRANSAVINRFGLKALDRIKKRAMDIYSGKVEP